MVGGKPDGKPKEKERNGKGRWAKRGSRTKGNGTNENGTETQNTGGCGVKTRKEQKSGKGKRRGTKAWGKDGDSRH